MTGYALSDLAELEAEAIHTMREVVASMERPVMLYSVGKDSSVMLRLAEKAFYPGKLPFPLLHVDTGFKFREMYEFRDRICADIGAELIVHQHEQVGTANPWDLGTSKCCSYLKTQGLLEALSRGGFDAAFGGARRDEERSRAKERVYSFRDRHGRWDPKNQRPELWNLYNGRHNPNESIRVFPLSNWTEADVWHYIMREEIPIVPMYYAAEREVIVRGPLLIPVEIPDVPLQEGEKVERIMCRFRTLGCSPCTGAVRSEADTLQKILTEVIDARNSERITRVIDHDRDGSMELKKREGYF
jgi:sulfate adenylyltransferase subunit 2